MIKAQNSVDFLQFDPILEAEASVEIVGYDPVRAIIIMQNCRIL
jgi:hypothetical protein